MFLKSNIFTLYVSLLLCTSARAFIQINPISRSDEFPFPQNSAATDLAEALANTLGQIPSPTKGSIGSLGSFIPTFPLSTIPVPLIPDIKGGSPIAIPSGLAISLPNIPGWNVEVRLPEGLSVETAKRLPTTVDLSDVAGFVGKISGVVLPTGSATRSEPSSGQDASNLTSGFVDVTVPLSQLIKKLGTLAPSGTSINAPSEEDVAHLLVPCMADFTLPQLCNDDKSNTRILPGMLNLMLPGGFAGALELPSNLVTRSEKSVFQVPTFQVGDINSKLPSIEGMSIASMNALQSIQKTGADLTSSLVAQNIFAPNFNITSADLKVLPSLNLSTTDTWTIPTLDNLQLGNFGVGEPNNSGAAREVSGAKFPPLNIAPLLLPLKIGGDQQAAKARSAEPSSDDNATGTTKSLRAAELNLLPALGPIMNIGKLAETGRNVFPTMREDGGNSLVQNLDQGVKGFFSRDGPLAKQNILSGIINVTGQINGEIQNIQLPVLFGVNLNNPALAQGFANLLPDMSNSIASKLISANPIKNPLPLNLLGTARRLRGTEDLQ